MGLRIIFLGTPDFAVPSLDILVKNGFDVVAVITATDKLGGRGGKKLLQSAVKKYALAHDIPVLQPKNLKSKRFLRELRGYKADLQVVVAFRMLPVVVWDMPPLGTMNLHGALLPKYRGAAPINWAVINGDKETGVSTFFLKHEIDTGDILFMERMPIGENETAGDVHDRMMQLGAEVVLKSVQAVEKGDYALRPQDDGEASFAPKIFHETCKMDFSKSTEELHNFVRGLSPYPAAWTTLEGKTMKVLRTRKIIAEHDHAPGTFLSDNKKHIHLTTNDGFLDILELQLQGKRRMSVRDFLNGYDFKPVTT